MAKTYEELLEQAAIIRDETAAGKNTATRVGGTITDAVDYVKELQDTYAGIHAEAAEAKNTAAAAKTKNAEQDGKISSLEAKDATHDTKIEKLEERVMQYLYPKIYQLNEGAGARVFHGFTEATGEGGLILTKDTYRYRVLYSTTQKQFVLNVTDEASGAGVRVGTFTFWPKISLPNNKSIASSESYAQRDCLYYIYVDGEGSTYYYIDSNGVASEKSATYLLRRLVDKNASSIAAASGTATEAKANADAAKSTAEGIAATAQAAKDVADDANIAAQDAKAAADGVAETAQNAKDVADAAKATAEQAKQSATNAFDNARDAISAANAASGTATEAKKTADEAKTGLEEAVVNLNAEDVRLNGLITANTTEIAGVKKTATTAYNYALGAQSTAELAQKAAENEATARTEADTELQSQINGKQDNIGSFSADEKADFLVSLGLGKKGIVSQKQTWNDVGVEPAYVMSEKVEGFISKDNIDSLISYGFAFNDVTGYFELNGLTDISLQEALNIVAAGKPNFSLCDLHYAYKKIRTNLPILDNVKYEVYFGNGISNKIRLCYIASYSNIEVFAYYPYKINNNYNNTGLKNSTISKGSFAFYDCKELEKIYIIPGTAAELSKAFNGCVRLKELELVYLKCDVNLSSSAYLSAKSIHIMIANAINTNAITITLHSSAMANWETSDDYAEDCQTIIDKNITIASL